MIFTKQERQVLLSFSLVIFLGAVLRFSSKAYPEIFHLINVVDSNKIISRINVNQASKKELIGVPYIGEYTARKILEYRKVNGPFTSLAQILSIKGIRKENYKIFSQHLKI